MSRINDTAMSENATQPSKEYILFDQSNRYTREWLTDKQILCYRFLDLNKATIDHWADNLIFEFMGWPDSKAWRLLLDIRLRGGIVNTYALRRAREIARMRPELSGRLAILVGNKLASDVISIAIRATNNSYRQRQIFVNEAAAVEWLLKNDSTKRS